MEPRPGSTGALAIPQLDTLSHNRLILSSDESILTRDGMPECRAHRGTSQSEKRRKRKEKWKKGRGGCIEMEFETKTFCFSLPSDRTQTINQICTVSQLTSPRGGRERRWGRREGEKSWEGRGQRGRVGVEVCRFNIRKEPRNKTWSKSSEAQTRAPRDEG